jgi:thioredoxin 2
VPVIRACAQCGQKNRVPARHLSDTGSCGACKAPIPPLGAPLDVDTALFDEIVQAARTPVLADFWAVWCGPCKMTAPEVVATAAEWGGRAIVLKVNTEEHPDLAARFGVQGIPTFLVFRHGQLVMQQAGAVDRHQLSRWLAAA